MRSFFTGIKELGAVERLGIVGAQPECVRTFGCAYVRVRSQLVVRTVNDVLIASEDWDGRDANELQVCRFRETSRVSCIVVTRGGRC